MNTVAQSAGRESVVRGRRERSSTRATACRDLIRPNNSREITERFGARFVDYLLVENGELSLRNTAWYMERLCARVGLSGDVLHVGCGFGVNPLIVAECCPQVSSVRGIDPDEEKIGVFCALVHHLRVSHVHPEVGLGDSLPYDDGSVDNVVCNESISHVKSIPRVLTEIRRTLRPGGRIVISDTARWNPYALWFKYGHQHLDENYQSKSRMRRYLLACGFRDIGRVPGLVAPRNPFRDRAEELWWLNRLIDPKYVLVGIAA